MSSKNKKIKQHLGGIYDFLQKKKIESFRELETARDAKVVITPTKTPKGVPNPTAVGEVNAVSFEQRKEINRKISRIEKQVTDIELKITEFEKKMAALDQKLSDPSTENFNAFLQEYTTTKKDFDKAMKIWEGLHEELEEWTSKKTW